MMRDSRPTTTAVSPRSSAVAPNDGLLLARSTKDPSSFDAFVRRHHDAVYRYVASRIGIDAANDVVADTFLEAYRVRTSFDASRASSDARPWLLGIATNRLGRHRDAERRWLRSAAHNARPADGDADRVLDRADAARMTPALMAALAQLPRRSRDPLLLFAIADLSYEEVSEALGIPVGTVRSRIARARTRLVGLLDGEST